MDSSFFSFSGEPVFDAAGSFAGYRGIARDITQARHAEERIRRLAHFDELTELLGGSARDRVGAFEAADRGTLFLDEIGELPLDLQPMLLRALETREIRRIGENQPRRVDVRVLVATNRRLEREVNHGRFREDLYFRISVVTVRVPPLRERRLHGAST